MKWKILSKVKSATQNSKVNVGEIVDLLLENRGMRTKREREEFLRPEDPMGEGFWKKLVKGELKRGLERAVKRVVQAIKEGEEMVVYGDYDADGICGTAILWEALSDLRAKAMPYIPERFTEGYGLNVESIRKLKEGRPGLGLVITVDHGIVAGEKIENLAGVVDVIVTDHHQLPRKAAFDKLRKVAKAVVHTTEVAGSGISWLLAVSLWSFAKRNGWEGAEKVDLREKLGLVAMGTVADLLPLLGGNRSLVKWGLEELRKTRRPGVRYLCEKAGIIQKGIDTYQIGFMIAPRLNAMGRMEHAMESLRLVCTKKIERAIELAERLQRVNRERQMVLDETVERARLAWGGRREKLIFVADGSFHEGVIGLVAGRLVEEFYLPAIVVAKGEKYSKASARSIPGLDIIGLVREVEEWLVDAGGHPMAAGFTVETAKLEEVADLLTKKVQERVTEEMLEKRLGVDMELPFLVLNEELVGAVERMVPFGLANPQPVFATRGVEVEEVRLVGSEGKHLKLKLRQGDQRFEAVGFGMGGRYGEGFLGKPVDVAYNLVREEWRGERRLVLKLRDLR